MVWLHGFSERRCLLKGPTLMSQVWSSVYKGEREHLWLKAAIREHGHAVGRHKLYNHKNLGSNPDYTLCKKKNVQKYLKISYPVPDTAVSILDKRTIRNSHYKHVKYLTFMTAKYKGNSLHWEIGSPGIRCEQKQKAGARQTVIKHMSGQQPMLQHHCDSWVGMATVLWSQDSKWRQFL